MGKITEDNRKFLNGVFRVLRVDAPWRLPSTYSKWNSMYQRFCRWKDAGIWEDILKNLIDEPDFEWLIIDASHVKVHLHGMGAGGGKQDIMAHTKGS